MKKETTGYLRAFVQTGIPMMVGMGLVIMDVGWVITFVAITVAMIVSFLINNRSEKEIGILWINNTDPFKTKWILEYYGDPNALEDGEKVTFNVVETM